MKFTAITLGLILSLNGLILAQSNPVPHLIANSNLNFSQLTDPSSSEYPSYMQGWSGPIARITPEASAPADLQSTGNATMSSNGSDLLLVDIINEGDNGISIRGSSLEETPLAIALAINTTNASGLSISWSGVFLHNFVNTTGSLHLQYRIGDTGDWTNLEGHVYTTKPYGGENLEPENFGPTALPAELDNQPVIQFRWMMVTHNVDEALSSTTPRIGVRSIEITTTEAEALPPIANFTVNKTNPSVEEPVSFKDVSSGEPTSFFWDFGDGTTSEEKKPVKVYEKDGLYSITFICTNDIGSDTLFMKNLMAVGDTSNIDTTTSINVLTNSVKPVKVFPNPSSGKITLDIDLNDLESISVFNGIGSLIKVIPNVGINNSLDLSFLPNGLYHLKLIGSEGISSSSVIIQK
jgi:hypothetical protein